MTYTTRMPLENNPESGQGRSWKSTLGVGDPVAAELRLSELGYRWQWREDQCLETTTPVLPAVIKLDSGEKSFFNQLIAAYLGWPGVKADPGATLRLGNGEAVSATFLQQVAELTAEFSFDVAWQSGDVALVDNHRVMHGRKPYQGGTQRIVLVTLSA